MAPDLPPDPPCSQSRRERDRGGVAVEYALLASVIAAVIAVAVGAVGTEVLGLFESAAAGFP